ncbi:MAG: polysaccharide biosynthesis protein, partial [Planctomycetales bacterium]|nr:polysaccharide biosynthesis protein [Planctomycetales bacterium]
FMTIPEASQLVIQAGAMGSGGEIFVLDMGDPVRIMDLAADMIRLSGFEVGEDIPIEIIGMRPGEKLYEELYNAWEHHAPTAHPKILAASSSEPNLQALKQNLQRLAVAAEGDDLAVVRLLKEIVPQFTRDAAPQQQRQQQAPARRAA